MFSLRFIYLLSIIGRHKNELFGEDSYDSGNCLPYLHADSSKNILLLMDNPNNMWCSKVLTHWAHCVSWIPYKWGDKKDTIQYRHCTKIRNPKSECIFLLTWSIILSKKVRDWKKIRQFHSSMCRTVQWMRNQKIRRVRRFLILDRIIELMLRAMVLD